MFIRKDSLISYSEDVVYFKKESTEREIPADEIISIEVTDPYRPFKTQEECWNEMHKHPDFGWVKSKHNGNYSNISTMYISCAEERIMVANSSYSLEEAFGIFTFTDGAPFGIKEE